MANGTNANKSRKTIENLVVRALAKSGYIEIKCPKGQISVNQNIGGNHSKYYIRRALLGKNIYDGDYIVDFLIVNHTKPQRELIIECRWQQSKGTTDQKYPFFLLNILKTNIPTVILLDGGGYKQAAKDWLKAEAKRTQGLLLGVWSRSEFQAQVRNGFLG